MIESEVVEQKSEEINNITNSSENSLFQITRGIMEKNGMNYDNRSCYTHTPITNNSTNTKFEGLFSTAKDSICKTTTLANTSGRNIKISDSSIEELINKITKDQEIQNNINNMKEKLNDIK